MNNKNHEKIMLDVLEESMLNNLIESFRNVYTITKKYDVDKETYVSVLNCVIQETIADCEEMHVYGFGWVNFFDQDELLEELLLVTLVPPYDFVELFHKYTDHSTSEIHEFIDRHCGILGLGADEFYRYL